MIDIPSFLEGAKAMADYQESKEIAEKLQKVHDVLQALFPDYQEQVKPVKVFISRVMEAQGKDILPATIMLMEEALEKNNAHHALWFMAAAVDMINEKKSVKK